MKFKALGFRISDRSFDTVLGLVLEASAIDKINSSSETDVGMASPSLENRAMTPSVEIAV